ncbi:hypothetical protein ACFWMP_25440 [Paenibacillus sp. NPDC058367]|uniref:hypothetical protein n=1 Tax=Paenibacillus sp. NPDC058367 TaxID=3346460 RepID=UPI003666ED1F
MKLIQDEAQYERARGALITMAAELDDPLSSMTDQEREKKNLIYDRTAESVREYRRSEMVVVYPGLKQVYEQLGYPYRDFSLTPEVISAPSDNREADSKADTKKAPERATESQQTKKSAEVNLSAWLED